RAARAGRSATGEGDRAARNIDRTREILCRAAVELERRPFRHGAIAEDHHPGRGAEFRRAQTDGRVAIDGGSRPAVAVLLREDLRHPTTDDRPSAIDGKIAAVDVIESWIERDGGAGIDPHATAIDTGIDRFGSFARVVLLCAARRRRE